MSDVPYSGWGTAEDRERLVLAQPFPNIVEIGYRPSQIQMKAAYPQMIDDEAFTGSVRLAVFNGADSTVTIIPRRTRPSMSMLKRKYPWLDAIRIELWRLDLPTDLEQAAASFFSLPRGFLNDWTTGLGVQKVYRPILEALRRSEATRTLLISRSRPTGLGDTEYVLNIDDWHQLAADMDRVTSIHQRESLSERRVVAHNLMLAAKGDQFEHLQIPMRRNALSALIARTGPTLTVTDRKALVREIDKRSDEIVRQEPRTMAALQRTIELVTLDVLIERFNTMLADDPVEAVWQDLLQTNLFLLSMVFGFPVVLIQSQAHIAGARLDGKKEKIADFLMAHDKTNNVALVEIKRSATKLTSPVRYRDIPKIGSELTSTVMQVLDQKQKFLVEFAGLRQRDRNLKIEAHAVGCVVVAGTLPNDEDERRAFELYRNSFKDVSIITFDELRDRLVGLRGFLAEDAAPVDGLSAPDPGGVSPPPRPRPPWRASPGSELPF